MKILVIFFYMFVIISCNASEIDDATQNLYNWGITHQEELNKFFRDHPSETSYFRWIYIGHNKYTMVFPAPSRGLKEGCFETAQGWEKGYMPGDMHVNDNCS